MVHGTLSKVTHIMPTETLTGKTKTKRIGMLRRGRGLLSESDSGRVDLDNESLLPPAVRSRLYDLFREIEREFETLYAENLALQERLNERGEHGPGDKLDGQDAVDGAHAAWKQSVKKSGSQFGQKLRLHYKTSTSKLVSSFRASASGCQQVREFRGHRDGVWEVAVSRIDPQVIGTASADHTARIWWAETESCLLQYLGHSGSVNSLRFHPTQDLVVTGSGDQTAHIWRAQISLPPHVENIKSHSSGDEELDSSEREDGDGVDSSDDKHEPTYVRQSQVKLQGHTNVVIAADWMTGGSQVVTASWDRSANLYDAESGELVNALTGHDQELTNVCSHISQKLVVTSSKDTTFRLWDFRDPALQLNVFQGHTQPVTTAVFAGADKIVSGSDDRTVKVWDLKNMRSPMTTIRTDSAVNRLAISSSQNLIAIPHDNRHIRMYDLNGVRMGRLPRNNRQGHTRMVCCTAWNERENATCTLYSCGFDRHVFGWNVNLLIKE